MRDKYNDYNKDSQSNINNGHSVKVDIYLYFSSLMFIKLSLFVQMVMN